MSLRQVTRCREYREGRRGRNRTYHCRDCGGKYQTFALDSVPKGARFCPTCRQKSENEKAFHRAYQERRDAEQLEEQINEIMLQQEYGPICSHSGQPIQDCTCNYCTSEVR